MSDYPVSRLNDLPIGHLISRVRGEPPPSQNLHISGGTHSGIDGDTSAQGHNQPGDTYGKSLFCELSEALRNDSTQTNEKSNISICLKAEEEELQISMNETTVRQLSIQKDSSKRSIDLINLAKDLKAKSKGSVEMGKEKKGSKTVSTLRSSRKGRQQGKHQGTNLRVKAKGKRLAIGRGSDQVSGMGSVRGSGISRGSGHGKRSGDSNVVKAKEKVRKKDAASGGRTKLVAPPEVKRPSRRGKAEEPVGRKDPRKGVAKLDKRKVKKGAKKEVKKVVQKGV
ncbi:hypothetical protein PVBG_03787, partial [Plasmodium vivax Brazil I]